MSDNIIKFFSAMILAIVVFINSIGNTLGIGDIIPTQPAEETTTVVETTETESDMPQTKEEIVAFFNTAINSVKPDSKSITSNYMKHAVEGEITGIPAVLESIGQSLITDNMGEDDSKKNVTWSTAGDKNFFFPVEGETWSSKLTADDVKEAKITEKDGEWFISITTVEDAKSENVRHGEGHAPKAFNVVLPGVIDSYIPGIVKSMFSIGTIEMAYPSSKISVTVDPVTGNVTHANYMMYWTIILPLGDGVAVLPFSTENDYTVNW